MTTYRYPFDGDHPVTSPYGPRGDGFHHGTDFGWLADEGPSFAVLATAAGTVVYVADETSSGGGRTMTVAHDDGGQSRYYHLADPIAELGEWVTAGELIAWSGDTGVEGSPHLHFELHDPAGNTYDPMTVLVWPADDLEPPVPSPVPIVAEEADMYVMVCEGFRPAVVDSTTGEVYEVEDAGTAPTVRVNDSQRRYIIDDIRARAARP
jgi:hypothetical protein